MEHMHHKIEQLHMYYENLGCSTEFINWLVPILVTTENVPLQCRKEIIKVLKKGASFKLNKSDITIAYASLYKLCQEKLKMDDDNIIFYLRISGLIQTENDEKNLRCLFKSNFVSNTTEAKEMINDLNTWINQHLHEWESNSSLHRFFNNIQLTTSKPNFNYNKDVKSYLSTVNIFLHNSFAKLISDEAKNEFDLILKKYGINNQIEQQHVKTQEQVL